MISEDTKKKAVKEYEAGNMTKTEVAKKYDVSTRSLGRWIDKYGAGATPVKPKQDAKKAKKVDNKKTKKASDKKKSTNTELENIKKHFEQGIKMIESYLNK